MKKTITISLLVLTTVVNAQIKIFPGGLQSYGSTTTPSGGEKHKFTGDVVISSVAAPTGSAIRLRGNNGFSTAALPDYTWLGNDQTGFFHPATNVIGFTIAGLEKMRLNASGFLGIGTTTPTEKLHVVGNTKLNGNTIFDNWTDVTIDWTGLYSSPVITPETDWYLQLGTSTKYLGDAYISHIMTRQSITFTSDQGVKQNINYNLSSVKAKLKQLKPASYNFKTNLAPGAPSAVQSAMSAKTEYGFIAQELIQVFPELVEKDNATNLYGVKYIEFIPLLISAFNEHQDVIDSLKKQINDCCQKNDGGKTNQRFGNTPTYDNTDLDGKSYIKQNKPNPFNKETVIEYNIIEEGTASILVFDMNGKLLKTISVKIPGKGSITINANDFTPGMYYYSLIVNDNEVDTKKMILTQ